VLNLLRSNQDGTPAYGSCVIAIDFGTSRTAYSYGTVGNKSEISIAVPPKSLVNPATEVKAQTILLLDATFEAIAFGASAKKAYAENERKPPSEKADLYIFHNFKMNLMEVTSDDGANVYAVDQKGRSVSLLKVITEAFKYLSRAAVLQVNRHGCPREIHDICWIVTIPAIWSIPAAGFMRRAVFCAGMIDHQMSEKLMLVCEPESACLDLLNSIDNGSLHLVIPVGAQIIVGDYGGGTNDNSGVQILSTNPMRCRPIKASTGGTYGAALIDKHISTLLEDVFGPARVERMKHSCSYLDAMDAWEQFKISFDGKNEYGLVLSHLIEEYNSKHAHDVISTAILDHELARLNSGWHQRYRITRENSTLILTESLIQSWFDEVIDGITAGLNRDLDDELCQNVQFIYLVGGFSSNEYAYGRIVEFINTQFSWRVPRLTVVQGMKPDIAIIRGAALFRLTGNAESMITGTIARYTYGITCSTRFSARAHDVAKKYIGADGLNRVKHYKVYTQQRDHVPLNNETPPSYFTPMTPDQSSAVLSLFLINDRVDKSGRIPVIYDDDNRLIKFAEMEVFFDMTIPFHDRGVNVSIKFGPETIIIARDRNGSAMRSTALKYFGPNRR
jgi:hypothetical protein